MAEQPQGTEESRNPRPKWEHDWHPYEDYLTVHTEHMAGLSAEGKVLHNGLSTVETRHRRELVSVNIKGRLECAFDVLILVDKWLEVRRGAQGHYEVKGYSYSYHAWLRGTGTTLIRYDSSHGLDRLHRHSLDLATSQEIQEPIPLGELPTLTDFIEQALSIAADLRGRKP